MASDIILCKQQNEVLGDTAGVRGLKADASPRKIQHTALLSGKRTGLPYPRIYIDGMPACPLEECFNGTQAHQDRPRLIGRGIEVSRAS